MQGSPRASLASFVGSQRFELWTLCFQRRHDGAVTREYVGVLVGTGICVSLLLVVSAVVCC